MIKNFYIFLGFLVILGCETKQKFICGTTLNFQKEEISIIPKPEKIISFDEADFIFSAETIFVAPDSLQPVFEPLIEKFKKVSEFDFSKNIRRENLAQKPSVTLFVDKNLLSGQYIFTSKEKSVLISASDYEGFANGMATLRQLLPQQIENQSLTQINWKIPAVQIFDKPQYQWRGLMLDVARHFFSKDYILKTIDRMSLLKINKLHLHLLDNEGWRIEIKKYPKLTEVGAWRVSQSDKHWNARATNSPTQKGDYGGFFTQEDIKEIVAYAQKYGIEIIPEIEMPAHTMSAIAAYPHLSCHKRPIAVPSGGVWPITDIYCAGQEETFAFLQDVLDEVSALFPSSYIHIGGDEATHTEWEKCPKCQDRMKAHNLKNAHELQAYFIKRIANYLKTKGKKLIGWDEIVEGGLPQDAVVMVWRGNDVASKAILQGSKVILTSQGYIDQYQGVPDNEPLAIGGYLPMKKIYTEAFEENKLSEEEKAKILGVQANLWAEYIPNEKHSEYMIFPRLLALSEVFWAKESSRNWENFMKRTQRFLPRLEAMQINYAKSIYQVKSTISEKDNKAFVSLESEIPYADIRYVFDNQPLTELKKYENPLEIEKSTIIKSAVFINEKPHIFQNDTIVFHKALGKSASFSPIYHKNYQGQGDKTLTNIVRGTKNFHDKQWLGWLVESPSIVIDLEKSTKISKISLGAMENQGSGIYFPTKIMLLVSSEGKNYKKIGEIRREFATNGYISLQNFVFEVEKQSTRFVKLEIENLAHPPKGGDAWLFVDEIVID